MMAMKSFTIFQLIEKILWLLLSSIAIFTLCYSTEATHKAISDFSTLFSSYISHKHLRNIANINGMYAGGYGVDGGDTDVKRINQRVEVLSELKRNFSNALKFFSLSLFLSQPTQIEIILMKISIQRNSFIFTCGYFDINMSLLHSVIYTSITYLVILLQFNFE